MAKHTRTPRLRSKKGKEICQQITDLILDYITGELHPDTASELEKHLHICPDCVAFMNTYKKTVEVTRSLPCEDIPPEMEKRVSRFLQKKMKGVPRKR